MTFLAHEMADALSTPDFRVFFPHHGFALRTNSAIVVKLCLGLCAFVVWVRRSQEEPTMGRTGWATAACSTSANTTQVRARSKSRLLAEVCGSVRCNLSVRRRVTNSACPPSLTQSSHVVAAPRVTVAPPLAAGCRQTPRGSLRCAIVWAAGAQRQGNTSRGVRALELAHTRGRAQTETPRPQVASAFACPNMCTVSRTQA